MIPDVPSARDRILTAADTLAHEVGAGNLSLDAVAERAGVSKGGLLYHFPSKARLMEAMVGRFVERFDAALSARPGLDAPNGLILAYLDLVSDAACGGGPPPSGLLAAMAENPGFMAPVERYERTLVARIRANATDPDLAMVAFLAVHGVRSMTLLGLFTLDTATIAAALNRLRVALHPPG